MNIPFLSLYDVTARYGAEINEAVLRVVNSGWYLQGKENERFEEHYAKYIGTKQKVLVEGKSKTNDKILTGRTETNKVVNFEGSDELIGNIVELKIISEHMWYLKGEVL